MKKIITIFSAAAIVLSAFTACDAFSDLDKSGKTAEEDASSAFQVIKSSLVIPANGGSASIELSAENPVNATTTSSWLTLNVSGNIVTATASYNESLQSRYAKVIISSGDEDTYLVVQQFGWASSGFEMSDIKVSSDAVELEYPYSYSSEMVVSTDVPWISFTVTENKLKVSIAENLTEASDGNTSRKGTITWKLGVDGAIVNVTQRNANFMREDSNWKVEYLGVQDYEGTNSEILQNTVGNPSVSGGYTFTYFTKSDFVASGKSLEDYIDAVATPALVADFKAIFELLASYGYNYTFADILSYDTDVMPFDIFEPGDYYGVAVGLDVEGEATGHYAYCEFSKKENGLGYESWLGEWTSEYGTYKDTWVITEKVKGSTYSISGIEGVTDAPIEAEYDSSSKGIVVRSYEGLGNRDMGSYGVCSLGFYGAQGSSFWRPTSSNYVIFSASLSDDGSKASLAPGSISSSSGDVTFEHCKYIGTTSEGKYVGIHSTANTTPLPHTLNKVGGGNGGGGGDTSAYKKWLGKWTVTSSGGDFSFTISENKADESYYITGWQMDYDWLEPMNATFDPSNGGIVLCGNSDTPVASDVNFGADENGDFYYLGNIIYSDGNEYYITSSGDYEIAEATLDSDTKATIKGLDCDLGSNGSFPFCRLQIGAITPSDKVYFFNNKPDTFPLTMTKATSGSSVKSSSISTAKQVNTNFDMFKYGYMRMDGQEMNAINGGVEIPSAIKKFIVKK